MRFTAVSAAVLAFASSVLAQTSGFNAISIPTSVDAGKTVKITWTAPTFTDSDVKVELIGGPDSTKLETRQTIVASIKNSALGYDWAVASTLGQDATYGIRISLVSDPTTFQYSNAFKIVGGSTSGSSSSASASGSSYPVSSSAVSSASASASASVSSAASTSAAISSTVVVPTGSSTVIPVTTSTPIGNLSTTAAPTQTTLTSSRASGTTTGSGSSSTTSVSVAAGAQATAGAVAMLGGLAVAMMAL